MRPRGWAALAAILGAALVSAPGAWAAAAGRISGRVIAGQQPVCVLALKPSGDAVATAATDGSGHYTLTGVPAGAWTVEFYPDDGCLGVQTGFAFQFYRAASTRASATPVRVAAGRTTSGIGARLPAAATISGSVADKSGTALAAVCAILEDTRGRPVLRQPTDAQGNYELAQLPPGHYIVRFVDDDCAGERASYASTYYPDSANAGAARVITVQPGRITGHIDATLAALPGSSGSPGGSGTGTTRGPGAGGGRNGPSTGSWAAVLLAPRGDRWTVDRRGALLLRLRCTHAARCPAEVIVRLPSQVRGHLTGGRLLGRLRVSLHPGPPAAVRIPLQRAHAGRLWIVVRTLDGRRVLSTVVPVRWL